MLVLECSSPLVVVSARAPTGSSIHTSWPGGAHLLLVKALKLGVRRPDLTDAVLSDTHGLSTAVRDALKDGAGPGAGLKS